ncbi:hypothetical protein [Streptomyces anulatus]|uniref:hypothetical protein n=1 Tax=Streptomyces anulatus TaxID=1892 RepID=UPI003870195C|nr:hypothetical protein OG536_38770 [Streptomyces anulatus]
MRQTYVNLCAFVLIIGASVALIALGLQAEQIITVSTAAGVLYTAWHQANNRPSAREDESGGTGEGHQGPS